MTPAVTCVDHGNALADGMGAPREADAFAEEVISCGAAVRVPGLLASPPAGALYRVADRHGVAVVALPATSLTRDEVASLLRFRLAQYLASDSLTGRSPMPGRCAPSRHPREEP